MSVNTVSQIVSLAQLTHGMRLSITSSIGQTTQVRNHVKIYPWRIARWSRKCYLDETKTPYTDKNNMNEFRIRRRKKDWQKVIPKDRDNRFNAYKWNDWYRSDPAEAKSIAQSRMDRLKSSLLARGSARESKPYEPPADVQEQIIELYKKTCLPVSGNQEANSGVSTLAQLDNDSILKINLNEKRDLKFRMLTMCSQLFDRDVPTSHLTEMETISDLVEHYSTPVRGINPYSAMLKRDSSLPPNLSLIADALRFDKETDTYFGGMTALPGIVSKVPGLRGSKLHRTLNQDEFQWPDI